MNGRNLLQALYSINGNHLFQISKKAKNCLLADYQSNHGASSNGSKYLSGQIDIRPLSSPISSKFPKLIPRNFNPKLVKRAISYTFERK